MTVGSEFSSSHFDPKAYVNELLSGYTSTATDDSGVEKYLLDAEMHLHVQADALGAEVTALREQITTELPRAARQLTQIKEEVGLLHVNIEYAMRSLCSPVSNGEDAGRRRGATSVSGAKGQPPASSGSSASQVFSELQQLQAHRDMAVKTKTMLEEASNLSSLFKTIDSMLQSDDLTRLADSLARFRKGLEIISLTDSNTKGSRASSSLSSSAVFQRNKVDQLEERVFDLAVKTLDSSLRLQNGDQCRRACVVLRQIDRAGLIAQHYCTIRAEPLMELWDSYRDGSGALYASWVGTFYEEVLRAVRGEMGWFGTYLDGLPGVERRMLVVDMLVAFFGRVEVPCKARLAGATRGGLSGVEAMEQVVGCTGRFVDALVGMLHEDHGAGDGAGSAGTDFGRGTEADMAWRLRVDDLVKIVVRPYDDMLRNYVSKEAAWLNETMEELLRDKVQGGKAGVSVIDDMYASVMGSLQRCQATTQSTALPELLDTVDGLLSKFCERVSGGISTRFSSGVSSSELNELLAVPRLMEQIRRVLTVQLAVQLRERVEGLQAGMEAFRRLESESGDDSSTFSGAASLNFRRVSSNADLSRAIDRLFSSYRDGHVLLPKLRVSLERANRDVESLIVRTFVNLMDVHLGELEASIQMSDKPGQMSPTASAYPSQYMISAGEQLMLLPQLLETSLELDDSEDAADESDLVGVWLERLGLATSEAYLKRLDRIVKLNASQCRQLSADVEYLCKIVNSLDCEVPVQLMAWAAMLEAGDEDGCRLLLESLGATPDAEAVARRLLRIRFNE